MDFEKLVPFIKKALASNNVTPDEVAAALNEESNDPNKDHNNESVDNSFIDSTTQNQEEIKNQEGKLLESTFKELAVEEAIEKAKEKKEFNTVPTPETENIKSATYWELLIKSWKT